MLKIVADKFKEVKIIVTGSSSFKLSEAVNESLTGRKHEFKLYPLSFKEMADYTSVLEESRLIEHRLIYGYYPEVVTSVGDEKEVIKELIDSYLYKKMSGGEQYRQTGSFGKYPSGHLKNSVICGRTS